MTKGDGVPTNGNGLSRRSLLRGAAALSGGVALSGLMLPAAPRAAEPVKLRVQNWFSNGDMQDWQVGLDMVKAKYPNLDFALEFVPYEDTATKTLVTAGSGDLPDIIMCSTDHTPTLITNGVLMDLGERIKAEPDINPDDFAHGVAQGFNMFGRWWGFPYDVSTFGVYYNKDMFDEAGVAYPPSFGQTPWTWDQFVDAAKKLTKPDGKQWGVTWGTPLTNQYLTSNFIFSAGGRNFSDDLKKCVIGSPEAAAGVQFMVDLMHKHKVAPPPSEVAGGDVNYFESGLAAMLLDGQWALGQTARNVDFKFDMTYLPLSKSKLLVTGGSGFAISATTKHPEEAWQFLKTYTSTEVLSKMIGSTGRGIPARVSAKQSYIDQAPSPNAAIFPEQLGYAINDRSVLGFPEFAAAYDRALQPIYNSGEGDVLAALKTVEDESNKVLTDRWANVKIKV
jgi:multiple sugar transport system substrate-binding protein